MSLSIKQLKEQADEDTFIDKNKLDSYSILLPRLSAKWSKLLLDEKLNYESDSIIYAVQKKKKYEYYSYDYQYRVENRGGEMNMYLDADPDLIKISERIKISKEKMLFIENIIKTLNAAGFNIRNAVEWSKFMSGGY